MAVVCGSLAFILHGMNRTLLEMAGILSESTAFLCSIASRSNLASSLRIFKLSQASSISHYRYTRLSRTTKMRLTSALFLASTASAISYPNLSAITNLFSRKDSGCPAVWTSISSELTKKFLSNGQCNPDARAAIREVFHDCGGMYNDVLLSNGE